MTYRNGIPFRSVTCGQCGLYHYNKEKCCAEKARCNKCFHIGHFARVCKTGIKDRVKSTSTKHRDNERMTTFIRRKTFQCSLPFYSVDNDYIKQNQTNSCVHLEKNFRLEINDLKIQNEKLSCDNKHLQTQNKALQLELDQKEKELISEFEKTDRQSQLLNIGEQVLSKCRIQNKRLQKENAHILKEHEHFRILIKNNSRELNAKSVEIEQLRNRLQDADSEIVLHKRHSETLSKEMDSLHELSLCLEDHTNAKLTGTVYEVLKFHIDQLIQLKQRKDDNLQNLTQKVFDLEKSNQTLISQLESYQNHPKRQPRNQQMYSGTSRHNSNKPFGHNAHRSYSRY